MIVMKPPNEIWIYCTVDKVLQRIKIFSNIFQWFDYHYGSQPWYVTCGMILQHMVGYDMSDMIYADLPVLFKIC